MRQVLRAGAGPAEPRAWAVLPIASGRLLGRERRVARDGLARERLVGGAGFFAAGGGRAAAGSFDDFPDAARYPPPDTTRGGHLGAATAGGGGLAQGQDGPG